jgi:major membrane immunogen (membrane-anchored lipoprotein)
MTKTSVEATSASDTGFGFLLFREVGAVKDIAVFYQDSNNVSVPLSKLELYNLHSGSQLRIKTGKYKIEYKANRPNAKRKGVIEATVKDGMITNVLLK